MDKIIESKKNGLDEIYDPVTKCTPKTKQIFKVERHFGRNVACSSTGCLRKNNIGCESTSMNALDNEPNRMSDHDDNSFGEENRFNNL